MSPFPLVTIPDAVASLQRRPALLLGPGATRAPGELLAVLKAACTASKWDALKDAFDEQRYGSTIDLARTQDGALAARLEAEIRSGVLAMRPAPDINHLARALWSTCISLTEDMTFESALRNQLDSIAGTRTLTIVDSPRVSPPLRTIPVYKLLGNALSSAQESGLALSDSDLLLRQNDWKALLASFPDHARESPLFVVGLEPKLVLARQVLGLLAGLPQPRPTALYFLKGDRCLEDPTIATLARRFTTQVVDASLRELCAHITSIRDAATVPSRDFPIAAPSTLDAVIARHSQVLTIVKGNAERPATKMELPRVVESLFRPAANDWRAFHEGLDLRRTVTDKILREVSSKIADSAAGQARVVVVRGEAGIGKTTTLKRVAVELARTECLVLWCSRSTVESGLRALRAAAKDIRLWVAQYGKPSQRFVIFCDDPWGLRLDVAELTTAFDDFGLPLVFVYGVRNSEYGTTDAISISSGVTVDADVEIPYELDSSELTALAGTLVAIGAAKDHPAAVREISLVPSKRANDVLCSLWYLVPETRMQFAESLRDEYCRLGSVRDVVGNLASGLANSSAAAHKAYELTTVTSSLDIGLPVEVLVRALGISYLDWSNTVGPGRPLWGLLYDVQDDENNTVAYFTRNEVVTRVLLELVNGPVGHAGQVAALRRLLEACDGGSIVYRSFVLSVLIRARKRLAEFLTFEQGMELFDIARRVLPFEDRVIEHHRGIWIQDVGRDDKVAYQQFERALQTEVYPGSERDAPKEHIHTSMAASVVKLIRSGDVERDKGAVLVAEHLRQATSARFFNPHTSHVSATLMLELAKIVGLAAMTTQALEYVVGALQEIERMRQVFGSRRQAGYRKDLEIMADLEKRVLEAVPDGQELASFADRLFSSSKSQVGFEVVARRSLVEASTTGKGRDFNEVNEYLNACMTKIEEANESPTAGLIVVRIDLMIRWTVLGFKATNWEALRDDLAEILREPLYRDDVLRNFYYAVALFHCGDLTEANAVFATLRRWQPFAFGTREIRCFYLDDHGNPRRFQGTYKNDRQWYFEVPELDTAILSRPPPTYGAGVTGHVYIGFAINGPLAQAERPNPKDLLF